MLPLEFTTVIILSGLLTLFPAGLAGLGLRPEWCRGLSHAMSYLACALLAAVAPNLRALAILGICLLPVVVLAIELRLLKPVMTGSRRRDYGILASVLGGVCILWAFPHERQVVVGSLLICGVCDPIAGLIGRAYPDPGIQLLGNRKSIWGGVAFAVTSFLITNYYLLLSGYGMEAVPIALFVALSAASLELVVPYADNLAILIWTSVLFHVASSTDGDIWRLWLVSSVVSLLGAFAFYHFRWLTLSGAVGAVLVVSISLGLGGWNWALPLAAFFFSGSILSKLRKRDDPERAPRRLIQVVVNGLVPLVPVFAWIHSAHPLPYLLFLAATTTACADTWATEIGRWSFRRPISLRTFSRTNPGASGAISVLGIVGSFLGSMVITSVAAAQGTLVLAHGVLLIGVGVLGALFDSVLGAWLQCSYQCVRCGWINDHPRHCDHWNPLNTGFEPVDNNVVNLAANLFGMCLCWLFFLALLS